MNSLRAQSITLLAVGVLASAAARPQIVSSNRQADVEQIARRLSERNELRRAQLKSYESHRLMTVTYTGAISQGEATESVMMRFDAPASKQFTVLSTSGAQLILDRVFQRALDAEQAAAADAAQRASALNGKNYTMRLAGHETISAGDCYVLDVAPIVPSEFTYTGRVWVQSTDFAVVRIQGRPAINPSPWISEGEFTTDFQKIGSFYFPSKTVSTSDLPLGLHARLTIQYDSYRILNAGNMKSV